MKSLRFLGDSKVAIVDVPQPKPGAGQMLVKVVISALCGSEMHGFYSPGEKPAGGHEFAGTVEDPNGNAGFAKGDRVAVHVVTGCGVCRHCQAGNEIFCETLAFPPNSHAEYSTPWAHHCLRLPEDIDWETGVLIGGDAMGVAYHLSRRVGVNAHDTVAVFGLGPIGLGIVSLWSFLGARVIGVDFSPWRREFAEKKLGCWKTVDGAKKGIVERLRKLTGDGPDICLEATGKPEPVARCFEAVRKGGKIGIVGEQGNASFNPSDGLIHKEVNVYGAWYFRRHEFPGMVELCRRGLKPKQVITHRLALDEAQKGYDLMAAQQCGKVVFRP